MISKECFVYIQLPNSHELVTVGKISWTQSGTNTDIGTFIYGQKYLKHPKRIALDPFNLPLEEREFEVTSNEGMPGPIRDASPDAWGRYVIQKFTSQSEQNPIGYLLNSAEDRVGALSFGIEKVPPAPIHKFNRTLDLENLIEAAHKMEKELPVNADEQALLLAGAATGGARPKATVEKNNELWLAKFPSNTDKHNFAKIEYATMLLAKDCDLNVPDVTLEKVGAQDVFLIKRFDRVWDSKVASYLKHQFVSGLTLLNLEENDRTKWSYLDLADQMRRWIKKPTSDLHQLYRRMVFNGLVSNTDDHPRNHGFLHSSKGYRLSPVYDLVPKPETASTRYLAMTVGEHGRGFDLQNLLSRTKVFDLEVDEATAIYESLKKKIAGWKAYYKNAGVSESDMRYLETAFEWML